jgi:hypothetical protein
MIKMLEKIVFILSTARTGTRTLAEGLRSDDILSFHQPAFSRLLTIASNFYLHGWLPERALEWLVVRLREPQILGADCRYYVQAYSLDHLPAKIISQRYPNVYIVHIVRDPRTFVPSYLNWMHTRFKSFVANKFVPGWHPSGFFTGQVAWRRWRRMDEFQRVCWHWTYKNALLERLFEGDERYLQVRFEDLFGAGPDALRSVLSFAGLPYRDEFTAMLGQSKNVSHKTYFPRWEAWKPEKQQQLLEICGEGMRRYGYL